MKKVSSFIHPRFYPIFLTMLFDQISVSIGFPVLTFLCFDKHSTLFAVTASHAIRSLWYGLINSAPHFIAIAAAPVLSYFSDHFGRKRMLMITALGTLLFSLFTVISILSGLILLLLIGSLVNGFCARTEPIALAIVSDLSDAPKKKINMGYLQVVISVGAFIGPIIGGYFAKRYFFSTLNFSLPFLISALFGIIAVLLTRFYFKETYSGNITKTETLYQSLKVLVNSNVLKFSVILALTQMSWRLYYQFVPPMLKLGLHYSPTMIGFYVALIAFWLIIASAFGIKFLDKFLSGRQILTYACYAMFFGLLMIILGIHLSGFAGELITWLSAIPMAMGDVIVYCMIVTFYSEAVSGDHQGKIMGLNFIVVSTVWFLTSLLGGGLMAINVHLPLYVAALILLFLLITLHSYRNSLY